MGWGGWVWGADIGGERGGEVGGEESSSASKDIPGKEMIRRSMLETCREERTRERAEWIWEAGGEAFWFWEDGEGGLGREFIEAFEVVLGDEGDVVRVVGRKNSLTVMSYCSRSSARPVCVKSRRGM